MPPATKKAEIIDNEDPYKLLNSVGFIIKNNPIKPNKDEIKTIDLHGFSLENANKTIDEFINRCFEDKITKITVITGKGLRSNNINNPYVSKNLSILKNSVPEFIKSNSNLMKKIKNIKEAKTEDGGSGAFNIFLKKSKE